MKLLKSKAHRLLKERANGIDLGQLSMITGNQFEHLRRLIKEKNNPTILDLGCGVGKIAHTLSKETEAEVTGIDASPEFIEQAKYAFGDKISASIADFDKAPNDLSMFDIIYSVDTLYFSKDLDALITKLHPLLKPNGTLVVFWTQTVDSEEERTSLLPDKTQLAIAFKKGGMKYSHHNYTTEERNYWKRAHRAIRELEEEFKKEGELEFYEHFCKETEILMKSVSRNLIRIYIYEAKAPERNESSPHSSNPTPIST
ncbi:Methyltransferase domain family [Verrucomicrobiia bacterium DG1235]|nr:Methyltransferase domain family [Verrucomicrobiae bacterium DG1235]